MQTFSLNPPINLVEESKWLLGVTFSETTNSVFNMTVEDNSFPLTTQGHWNSETTEKTMDELNKLIDFRSENDFDLHVEQFRKKGIFLLNDYSLSNLGMFKNEILEELKKSKHNDLEEMVYRFQLTCYEIIDILDLKYIPQQP